MRGLFRRLQYGRSLVFCAVLAGTDILLRLLLLVEKISDWRNTEETDEYFTWLRSSAVDSGVGRTLVDLSSSHVYDLTMLNTEVASLGIEVTDAASILTR